MVTCHLYSSYLYNRLITVTLNLSTVAYLSHIESLLQVIDDLANLNDGTIRPTCTMTDTYPKDICLETLKNCYLIYCSVIVGLYNRIKRLTCTMTVTYPLYVLIFVVVLLNGMIRLISPITETYPN